MAKKPLSPAKQKVVDFITNTNPGENELFVFSFRGNQEQAEKFVHQMRVELSRMRQYVREQGRSVKAWKMILEGVEVVDDLNCKITLRRTISLSQQIANDVSDILEELDGGRNLNVS